MIDRPKRADYRYFANITSRWSDNDIYGHINNVAYYSYFDSAANQYLIENGLDIQNADIIGIVVESMCQYHVPLAYPQPLVAGVRVDKLGNRAVTYGIAIFSGLGDATTEAAAAHGHFVHVFVGRQTRVPVAIPAHLRAALEKILR